MRMSANAYFSSRKRCTAPASRKYIARRPRMAKTFEVKTMSGSFVSAKIAGTESIAKITSLSSRNTSATSSGVA